MLSRSHSQEGHGVGCQCGCSSKVIHYPQVAETVAPTSGSSASEAARHLEQPLNGQNCPSARFYDAGGGDSCVGGQKHTQGDYKGSGILTSDSLDNFTVSKASTNFLRPEGVEFKRFLADDETLRLLLDGHKIRRKEQEGISRALVAQGASFKQVASYKACSKWTLYGLHKQEQRARLFGVNRCGNHKVCPICAAIKARKDSRNVYAKVSQALGQNPHLALSMLTLTVPKQNDLEQAYKVVDEGLKQLNAHIRRVKSKSCRHKSTLGSVEGTFRAIEVAGGTHVHAHILILHSKFIKIGEVQKLWARWTDIEGKTKRRVVDIRNVCKPYEFADGGDDARYRIRGAVIECAKYTCKMASMDERARGAWWRITYGKRLQVFTGCLRGLKLQEQQAEDIKEEDWEFYAGRYDEVKGNYTFEHIADLSDSEQAEVRFVFKYGWMPPQLPKKSMRGKIETITVFRGGNVEKIHRPSEKVGITECRK